MLRERHESTGDVAGVIRDVRTRWRRKLLVRGGPAGAGGQRRPAHRRRVRPRVTALHADRHPDLPHRHHRRHPRTGRVGVRPAAAAPGERRAGGVVPGGARAVAQHAAAQCHERRAQRQSPGALAGAGAQAGRRGDRPLPGHRRRARHRATAGQALRADGGRRLGVRRGRVHPRPGLPAPRAVGDVLVGERRGRGAVPDRPHARERHRAARLRPTVQGDAQRLQRRRRRAPRAQGRRHVVRAGADAQGRRRQLRGHGLRPRRQTRVPGRGRRRAFWHLHARRHRPALRPAHRPRVPLPRLHRPRTADGRGRRRHRRADRHRSARHGHADDADHGRPADAARERQRAARGRGRGQAHRVVRRRQGRLLPRRPAGSRRDDDHRFAAVRDRRAHRHGADGGDRQARAR